MIPFFSSAFWSIHGSGIDNIQKFRKCRSKYEGNQDEGKDKEG